jgi:hypothetical protein
LTCNVSFLKIQLMSGTNAYHENLISYEKLPQISNRKFGLTLAVVLLVLATVPLLHGGSVRPWAVWIASGFVLSVMFAPSILAPLNTFWMKLGLWMHKIVSPVILGVLFFAMFTPMGLVMRLFGHDPLRLRLNRRLKSHWVVKDSKESVPETMKYQF